MTDHDVQREIEENERRVRDEHNVDIDEDVLEEHQDDGTFIDDALDAIPGIGEKDSHEHDVEYDDNDKTTSVSE